ncbi:MAG: site-2 protease family protein [Proteobacteria bacterium]|nr:site-2 protease family protein [Pseudomonadota bacterium]
MKALLALFTVLKLGKVLASAGSMLATLWIYALLYGWRFAAGFIGLLFVHEMGHYLAARQRRLDVSLPYFIPFFGAAIMLREQPHDAETEAYVAYAGPFVGSLAAFACYFIGRETGDKLWFALAQAGFFLNLFNLVPIHPLDGGRITAVLSPRIWLLGVPMLIALFFYYPSPILIIIAILALPSLAKAWRYDPSAPENQQYYGVPASVRFEYMVLYLGLAAVLALQLEAMGAHLGRPG